MKAFVCIAIVAALLMAPVNVIEVLDGESIDTKAIRIADVERLRLSAIEEADHNCHLGSHGHKNRSGIKEVHLKLSGITMNGEYRCLKYGGFRFLGKLQVKYPVIYMIEP